MSIEPDYVIILKVSVSSDAKLAKRKEHQTRIQEAHSSIITGCNLYFAFPLMPSLCNYEKTRIDILCVSVGLLTCNKIIVITMPKNMAKYPC